MRTRFKRKSGDEGSNSQCGSSGRIASRGKESFTGCRDWRVSEGEYHLRGVGEPKKRRSSRNRPDVVGRKKKQQSQRLGSLGAIRGRGKSKPTFARTTGGKELRIFSSVKERDIDLSRRGRNDGRNVAVSFNWEKPQEERKKFGTVLTRAYWN